MADVFGKNKPGPGGDGVQLTRAASLEAFVVCPIGRYLAGPTWFNLCAQRDLWIQVVWGRIDERDLQGLLDSLRLASKDHGQHALLFDCSGVEDMTVKDAHRLRRFLAQGQSQVGPRSTRQALVCSPEARPILRDGRDAANPRHTAELFGDFNDALVWLAPLLSAAVRASILDVRAALTPVACPLARLRKLISDEDVTSIDIAFATRQLGCSRRSLQRQLARRGTSFGPS